MNTLPVHLVHATSFKWRPSCSFAFVTLYDFSYFMFFVVHVCFPCLVFVPGLHSYDYRYNLGSLDYSFYDNKKNINGYKNMLHCILSW